MTVFVYARLRGIHALVSECATLDEAKRLTKALRAQYPSPAHFSYGHPEDVPLVPWRLLSRALTMTADDLVSYLDTLKDQRATTGPPRKARAPSVTRIRKAARFNRSLDRRGPVYHQALRKTPKTAG